MNKPDKARTKTVFRLGWVWREAAKANWLQEMSKKGWHLRRAFPLVYVFERGEPTNYAYRFDFRLGGRAALAEYLDLCREAGWQHVYRRGGWHCLRIDADTHRTTELYTDRSGLTAKYKRLLLALLLTLVPTYGSFLIILYQRDEITSSPFVWLVLAVIAFYFYVILRVALIIRRLRGC